MDDAKQRFHVAIMDAVDCCFAHLVRLRLSVGHFVKTATQEFFILFGRRQHILKRHRQRIISTIASKFAIKASLRYTFKLINNNILTNTHSILYLSYKP